MFPHKLPELLCRHKAVKSFNCLIILDDFKRDILFPINWRVITAVPKILIEQNRCAMACQGYGAVFLYTLIKSSGNQVLQVVLLSHHNQQSNRIDIPTAYDKNTIELPFWQAVLLC